MNKLDHKKGKSEKRIAQKTGRVRGFSSLFGVHHRSNIALARLQDQSRCEIENCSNRTGARHLLATGSPTLNMVELFAGAGGMGLGFMLAANTHRPLRLVFSGEIHPIYARTLKANLQLFSRMHEPGACLLPEDIEPIDLKKENTVEHVARLASEAGGVHLLIGGPPCQGFSSANRNSWSSDNPNNYLVNVFMRYVKKLTPPAFLMENVQGIVWTARNKNSGALSVAEHVSKKMNALGYLVFPKLLDAVWYGVPQYRTRFFLLGIHRDTGYCRGDFDEWGPFPSPTHGPSAGRPFVTTRDAIEDLPAIGNGHGQEQMGIIESSSGPGNEFLKIARATYS